MIVVASLNDNTWWNYNIGFPSGGHWLEVFNSDVYDNWVNPMVAGNGGAIDANASPAHNFRRRRGMWKIQNIRFQLLANLRRYRRKHYVHVGLIADWKTGEPKILEPEKCREWKWYDLDNLPSLFRASQLAIEAYKTSKNYFVD